MPRSILDAPLEVLQKIVQYASLASPLGPPTELASLLLTCRSLHIMIYPNCGDFYLNIFAQKFDINGPISRLGYGTVRDHAQLELHRRFSALKLFKEEHVDHPELTEALWIAYVMLSDCEDNSRQLLWAGLPSFLGVFIRKHLYRGADSNHGWPILNPRNSLALALSWLLCSRCEPILIIYITMLKLCQSWSRTKLKKNETRSCFYSPLSSSQPLGYVKIIYFAFFLSNKFYILEVSYI